MTDLGKTLSNLENDLKHKRKATIWNHFLTLIEQDYAYSGSVDSNGFAIWKRSNRQGVFYTTIVGKIVEKEGQKKIVLNTKLNKFGKFLILIFLLSLLFTLLNSTINYQQAYDGSHYFWQIKWKEIFMGIGSAAVFSSVMIPVMYYVRGVYKKEELKEFREQFIVYSNSTNQDYF